MLDAMSSGRSAAYSRTIRRRRLTALAVVAAVISATALASGQIGARSRDSAGSPLPREGLRSTRAERTSDPPARRPALSSALQPGSDPNVLPGPLLIADRDNNRLLEVNPRGKVQWRFPERGNLAGAQTFLLPDDAFFSPNGRQIVATQEDDFAISVISISGHRIVYRYGHPGVPGSEADYVYNPDDAMLTPSGELISADIKNCRVLVIRPPAHQPLRQLGITGDCEHQPGVSFGSPNGAFPMSNGDTAITEINEDWLDVVNPAGRELYATHPPGFSYPSDTNEVRPGLFLSADYTDPGALETFTPNGRLVWRYEPSGSAALDQPSLAVPLPNGDVLANDDKNDRVIVIDPHTDRIVWQYGHTHVPGSGEGFLSNPDGVDLAPPYSLTRRFASSMRAP
jgi:outer membrane protein assembly factor BamB